jgi:hypothetical protein
MSSDPTNSVVVVAGHCVHFSGSLPYVPRSHGMHLDKTPDLETGKNPLLH